MKDKKPEYTLTFVIDVAVENGNSQGLARKLSRF